MGSIPIRKKSTEEERQPADDEALGNFSFRLKCVLSQILENINKKCLRLFKEQEGLELASQNRIKKSVMYALMGIKKFMLLEKGDFLQEFFNSANSILDKQKGLVSHNRVYSCIDEAIKNSSVKTMPQ